MTARTYVRPMSGWWRRNGYYRAYVVREATSVLVTAYALVLLIGLLRLSQGRAAYDGWLDNLASPWSIAFHVVALVSFAYHAWTWFAVMPKTMPLIRIRGQRVADRAIIAAGALAAVLASVALFAAIWWTRP